MKRAFFVLGVVAVVVCTPVFAAIKPCEELKGEIEAKLQAKGVSGCALEILPADQVKEQKVVGSCEGSTKKITYSRN